MLKILIADDNLEFSKIIFNKLKNSNKQLFDFVNVSSNGKEALDYILNNTVDLLLLDLQMPILTGIELLKEIKNLKNIPNIIILTGNHSLLHEVFKLNIQITNIFIKPFNIDDLINSFDTIISNNKLDFYNKQLYENVVGLLDQFNFNKASIGYKYLIDCIIIYIKNDIIVDFSKDLYEKVAIKNNVEKIPRIQWALEKTILAMNKYTNINIINNFFHNEKPTPKTFIIKISSIIINQK